MNNFFASLTEFLNYTIIDIKLKKLLIFFGILFVFFLLKQILSKILFKSIKKLTAKTKTEIDDYLIESIEKPLKLIIVMIGFHIAFLYLNLPPNPQQLVSHVINSFIIFAIFWALYKSETIISNSIEKYFKERNYELIESFLPFINKFIKVTIIIFGVIFIIQEWGYNVGALITGLGIGGVAVALAAKDTLANFFGSIMILIDRPFRVGDWIICNNIEGIVEDIGFRSTRVRTFAKALVSIPNSIVATSPITNWSLRDRRRIKTIIGVTYSTPRDKLERVVNQIREMLINHQDIHDEPLMVYFTDFNSSSLDIFIYCFTKTSVWSDYLAIKQDVNLKIMEILESLEIEFAFPSTSIYVEKLPENLKV
ncbi:mechanosensitive ion channel, MscS family [Deferribacter desulfuricans SSM1]|uniref:Mechanosensitive ion channel, MscS family n=1 Tax=Deferribacter desulfuricans (strain DSM 14783 / JCM 11476 / NBRC 101012 / SSM1) TaxID=639282 RepID=D3PDS2_DEFDS|nr:mechanosensitive ion channel family protein [Deferribacter desulfuricans]BAI80745.1 mechanosensitive ion channel, MscS family [Deferribacter desulfuricans SSM1]